MTLELSKPQDIENHVAEILVRCRQLVDPAMRETINQLSPWPGRMAAFSFGWCAADGTPHSSVSGKNVRPAIAVLCAQAMGAPADAAVAGAVAVELVHAFSLIHDDVMDGDERRRHRATVWKTYGVGPAVLAGDALLALALHVLAQADGASMATIRHLSTTLVELVDGQAQDLAFESRPWVGPDAVTIEEYQTMAAHKTGSLLGCAAALGTLLGGGSTSLGSAMSHMGRRLGLAFQAVDDLLGIWGDPDTTGKPVFNDLRKGKKTLPVVAALANNGHERTRPLVDLLESRTDDQETLWQAAELVTDMGGRSFAQRQAALHLDHALDVIDGAGLDRTAAAELMTLARFLVHRTH